MTKLTRLLALSFLTSVPAFAANFDITTTVNSGQSLSGGQTGNVSGTGKISVSGSTVGVTFNGASASTITLTNSGTIEQTGTGRALRSNTAGLTLSITNNATGIIQSTGDDTFQISATGSDNDVVLHNYGIIRNNGTDKGQAIDWANVLTGDNTLNNYSTGQILTTGADAVRLGVNGILSNAGTIQATPYQESPGVASGSDGVDLQNNSGAQIANTGLISGRHGITGGDDSNSISVSVTNNAGGTIEGSNGSGINIDNSASTVTVINNGTIIGKYNPTFTDGDGDGVDVDGIVNITNNGFIRGTGAAGINQNDLGANNAEGISIGGGTIVNNLNAEITGQNINGTPGRLGNGILVDNSSGGDAFAATSVTNSGLIRGYTGFGIKMVGTWNDTIVNNATGTIRGGTTDATIQTGAGDDTLTNRGTITSDTGFAIDLGDGNDTLKIEGTASTINGSVTGGTGTNTLIVDVGAGNSFSYSGSVSNFSTFEVRSGSASLSGVSTFEGTVTIAENAGLTLVGSDRFDGDSVLELDGGTLSFASIDTANGQRFSSLALGMDSLIDLNDTTTLTFGALGTILADASLTITGYDPGLSAYAIRFEGDLTGNSAFQAFAADVTIDGQSAEISFSGGYTQLSAVPEPSTIALCAIGLISLFWWRSRKPGLDI